MKNTSYEKPSIMVMSFEMTGFLCLSQEVDSEVDQTVNKGLHTLSFQTAEEAGEGW